MAHTPRHRRRERRRAEKLEDQLLTGLGLDSIPNQWEGFIDKAIRKNWNFATLQSKIVGSKKFEKQFPGLKREDGTLRMSIGEYRSLNDYFQSVARQYGIDNLSKNQLASLQIGNVSPQEFNDRMVAVQRARDNAGFFAEMAEVARTRGMDPRMFADEKSVANALLGNGSDEFYQLYRETVVGSAARGAGLQDILSQDQIKGIAGGRSLRPDELNEAEVQQGFQRLAQQVRELIPKSRMRGLGLSTDDLIQIEFGGPRQAQLAEQAQRILEEEDRAGQFVQRSTQGSRRSARGSSL